MKINVPHIAKLANLELRDDEIPKFEKQLSSILDYVKKLQEVDTTEIAEISQSQVLENVSREDSPTQSLLQTDIIPDSKNKQGRHFKVKGVLKKT